MGISIVLTACFLSGCGVRFKASLWDELTANNSSIATMGFASTATLPTSSGPLSITLSDLDGDGKLDVVTADAISNQLSIRRNTSSVSAIGFAASSTLATGTNPFSVFTADLDGDLLPDLLSADISSDQVSIRRNTSSIGSISFAALQAFGAAGGGPVFAIASDLDGDGLADLIRGDFSANAIRVRRNTSSVGSISFAAQQNAGAIGSPFNGVTGDIDGDGRLDIVAATCGNTVVIRNTSTLGSISFAALNNFVSTCGLPSVFVSDLDGDGKLDVISYDANTGALSTRLNTSTVGSISLAAASSFTAGAGPTASGFGFAPNGVYAKDMNLDGKPDVLVSDSAGNQIAIYINQSTIGNISLSTTPVLVSTGSGTVGVVAEDLNGDSLPDVVSVNYTANDVTTVKN